MARKREPLAEQLLDRLTRLVHDHPRWVFYPSTLLLLICILFTIASLQFSTSRNDLVGGDKAYHKIFLEFLEEFNSEDDIVAMVESGNLEKNRQFAERLAARLKLEPELFTDVFYKGDLTLMGPKALLFVPHKDLYSLHENLSKFSPFISEFSHTTNLVGLYRMVNKQFRRAATATSTDEEKGSSLVGALPALIRITDQARDSLSRPGIPPSPGVAALFDGGQRAEQSQYLSFDDGRIYIVTAKAANAKVENRAVKRLRELVNAIKEEVPGVNAGITGQPVLNFDEMQAAQRDTSAAAGVALAIVAMIFIYAYQETGRPLKATICLLIGIGYTMGFTTLAIGHLNILTITFVPILIGLAIDFGVHLITRYEEELRIGQAPLQAMRSAMVHTGTGIFTSGFTTAGAFFAMAFTDFKGIQEMGIISGGGLLVCLIPMMTLLPVLLFRGRQNRIDQQLNYGSRRREAIERIWLNRPRQILVLGAVFTLLAFTQFPKVHFDYNLLNLQTRGLEAVELEEKFIAKANKSVIYGAVVADSLEETLELEKKLMLLPSVGGVDSMATYLNPVNQVGKLEIAKAIQASLQGIAFEPIDTAPVDLKDLSQAFYSLQGWLGTAATELEKRREYSLASNLLKFRESTRQLQRAMLLDNQELNAQKLGAFQRALYQDVRDTFLALQNQDTSKPLEIADLPPTLKSRFIGKSGKYLIQVYPRENVWERAHQEAFVKDLRTIDPKVTGTPVQLYEYTSLLKDSFVEAAWYALLAIAILVFLHFRRISCVLLSLVPVFVGSVWMVGAMGLLGIDFNPANIMTVPLVIGIGVTSGIHILNRFAEENDPRILAKSTGKAVLVSALTTIAGFGSLMLAKHQGIASLGAVMSIGVTTCMIAALTFFTALLKYLTQAGWCIKNAQRQQCTVTAGPGGTEEKTSFS